jgi:anti-sigma-K factor RskA
MRPHDWYVENRTAFVVRALEIREERLFADHLPRCDECRREVARLEQDLGALPMAAMPVAPRPGLARHLADAVLNRRVWWRRAAPALAAAAVLVLAIGFGLRERAHRSVLVTTLAERERELSALRDTLSIWRESQRVVQRDIAMGNHKGGLLIFDDPTTHRWNVVMHGLPAAPTDSVYQFWFITRSGMVRSVALRMEDQRPAFATVPMPGVAAPVTGAALTVEQASAPAPEPKGELLAHVLF